LSQGNVRSSSSVRLAATSTRSHRALLRGRDETAASLQASSLRGGRFGMVTHRWWGNKFCKRTCKNAYLRENHHTLSGWVIPRFFAFADGARRLAQVTLPPAGKSARRTDGRSRSQFRRARRARERTIALPPQWPRHEVERSFPARAKRPVAAGPGGARGALPRLSRGIEFQWDSHWVIGRANSKHRHRCGQSNSSHDCRAMSHQLSHHCGDGFERVRSFAAS
jgi:hypothetical protein